ncbi:glycogen operon protein GlgX [Streptomyces narbonensis]
MTERDWHAPTATLGLYLSGRDIPGRDERGDRSPTTASSPSCTPATRRWSSGCRVRPGRSRIKLLVDTTREDQSRAPGTVHRGGGTITVGARSTVLLRVRE